MKNKNNKYPNYLKKFTETKSIEFCKYLIADF